MDEWALLQKVADLLATRDSRQRGDVLMQTVLHVVNGRRCALFERQQEALQVQASSGLDREVLQAVQDAWALQRAQLQAGSTVLGRGESKVLSADEVSWAIAPVFSEGRLLGALYVDSAETAFDSQRDMPILAQLARMAAGLLVASASAEPTQVELYIGRLTLTEIGREQLALLVSQHEGNVARIARLLQVTRATVYNRLKKHGLMGLLEAYRPSQS
ncbi:MAG TPA: GAF domain-containing protein [Vicinamibacteria bacterium]